ncbi:hypothetical protein [Streptacidiphilus jiangxiensis]|uniref:Secreted protein n=1 Tax=Streptacidiphilus jiangxiensis TaxID=235985 RepID=A0A1H7V9Y5_STRJI|nr:hypothetical protein [Streptacidiphilus jiangxiensis]SEM06083.1 hypothetical protein SAMN05414137_117191 [Streptacidiphilus jiangxiensis]
MALLKLAAILLAGGATLVPAAAATSSSTSGSHQPAKPASSTTVVLLDCAGKAQTKPATYVLACGDGNNYLTGLHWSTWSADAATGTGTDVANDCKPYCAAGHFHSFPVNVRLTEPVPWTGHPGQLRYTSLTLDFTGARPPGMSATVTWPLPKPAAAVAGA